MQYIKLDSDMNLIITVRKPIYRGDNLSQTIRYLIPLTVGDIDVLSSYVYLNYIRADGVPDVVILERLEEKYNDNYYQYTFPVDCKLSRFAGEVCTWLHFYAGDISNPQSKKSGECILRVQDAKNMDDYLCDHQLTALYQIHKQVDDELAAMDKSISKKADGLLYNKETRELQLSSGEEALRDPVVVPADGYISDGDDEWSDMTDSDVGDDGDYWEPM